MNIIRQNNVKSGLRPIAPKIVNINSDEIVPGEVQQTLVNTEYVNGTLSGIGMTEVASTSYSIVPIQSNLECTQEIKIQGVGEGDNAITPSRVSSPTSISNLLEMALTSHDNNDIVLSNVISENKDDANITSFAGEFSLIVY